MYSQVPPHQSIITIYRFLFIHLQVAMEMEEIMEDPVNQPQAMPHKVITHMEATEDPQGVDIRDQDPHHQAHHIIPTGGESITDYHYHYWLFYVLHQVCNLSFYWLLDNTYRITCSLVRCIFYWGRKEKSKVIFIIYLSLP